MHSLTLQHLRLPMSKGVLGTMNFGDTVDESLAGKMVEVSLEAGVTMLDTANAYSGGACEEIVGRLIRDRTEDLMIATKVGIPHADSEGLAPLSSLAIERSLEGSVSRLGVEKVDLYYLHAPDRQTDPKETIETLKRLHDKGMFDAWGFSNYSAWQALQLIQIADSIGLSRPVLGQQLYNVISRKIESEYLEFSSEYGLHLMVYNPMAGGLLSGKHKFESQPESGRFGSSKLSEMYKKRYWNHQLFDAIESLSSVAAEMEKSLPELAFQWLQSKQSIGSILLGASTLEQLNQNLLLLELPQLTVEAVAAIDYSCKALEGPMISYNR